MNKFFINGTKNKLNLKPFKNSSNTHLNLITSVSKNYVSIRKIQECFPNIEANNFNFRQVSWNEVKSEILNLNVKTSSSKASIPATLKQCIDTYLQGWTNLLQNSEYFLSFFTKIIDCFANTYDNH